MGSCWVGLGEGITGLSLSLPRSDMSVLLLSYRCTFHRPSSVFIVGALEFHHEVDHPLVRLNGASRRPTPAVTGSSLRSRGTTSWPGEDLGVELLERAGGGGDLVRARFFLDACDAPSLSPRVVPGTDCARVASAQRRRSSCHFAYPKAALRTIQQLFQTHS